VREFLVFHLGLEASARHIIELVIELEGLANRAAEAGAAYLLHRDYQSQNSR